MLRVDHVARDEREQRVVDRKLRKTRDALPFRAVLAHSVARGRRDVGRREAVACPNVVVTPTSERFGRRAERGSMEGFVDPIARVRDRPELVVGETAGSLDERLDRRGYAVVVHG